ncbi:TetR/AcrR family transcriptional regulator [Roseisalinus antarcticus]|uniref:Fatty acid metabolism regulator protein n=1 Tax=Roseisalinus antarcticus TaxID=254357 RepID=A0A1Y5REU1_9RHOB|nr:TetR/AcrR family transcriptional regulator [Roseisalinus antarcticus]SLN15808.1 Fatty acid metabolism regulator protein [Roseisalinus antarcticus]
MSESRRRRRKDARPEEIIDAALAEFAEMGFAGTSMGRIAARAGIARPTVYLYFETKDAIFEAAVADRMGGTVARAQDILTRDIPFDTLFTQLLENYYTHVVGSDAPALFRVLIAEGRRFPGLVTLFSERMLGAIEDVLHKAIAHGIARGEVRPEVATLDLRVVFAPAVMAMIWGLIFDEVAPLDRSRYMRSHLDIILRGLRV